MGGKRNLAKRITSILDGIPHQTYAEPFVGMGGIFLRRSMRPRCEVINDFGRDVSNLFRILQRHYPQFLSVLRFQLTTRTEFIRLVETNPETLTDLERAARFLYLHSARRLVARYLAAILALPRTDPVASTSRRSNQCSRICTNAWQA